MLTLAYTMHQGKLCRQQQDCILIDGTIHQDRMLPITAWSLLADEVLLAVADGVASSGGNRRIAPQQASRIVLEELVKAVREHPEWLQDGFVANRHARHIQTQLSNKLADNPKTYGAASTLAVAHVRSGRAAILNVGDSRVYQANREGQWRRLSKDHTVLQGMIDRGEASPDTEYASLYGALEHGLCADPEASDFAIHRVTVTLEPGDRLVLCSDGIHDQLGEDRLWALFDPALDVAAQAKVWRDAVWRDGAKDNFSLVVVMIET
ncbi:MAG: protein phosphatase 2C domain-containing protein [Candidatus Competibacteraceae bacterium]|nr:protein phosphatase 2C domain-containing protein [Candidatus Competibacteraceae bacterium]